MRKFRFLLPVACCLLPAACCLWRQQLKNKPNERRTQSMKYECPCMYVYDETTGDPDHGIPPGTKWENVPENFTCPLCGLGKDEFTKIE